VVKVMKIVSISLIGADRRDFFNSRGSVSFSSRTFLCCLVSFVYFDVFGVCLLHSHISCN
jgi:hypothetical protein